MKQMLRGMAKTKIPRQMTLQVLAEDQSTKEQLEAELKHHQGTNKFRMPDLKLIRQELEEWLQGIREQKNSAAFANQSDNCICECNA